MDTKEAEFRFYRELNDFLPKSKRQKVFIYPFFGKPSIKVAIEGLGVPHTEVDLILINGESVDFNAHLKSGDRVAVYPAFESLDISPLIRLRPDPLREIRFICDVHLSKLAHYLRLLGFDTDCESNDEEIIRKSISDHCIILTRDLNILKHGSVTHGYFLRHIFPKKQTEEIVQRFDLRSKMHPFTRCLECNGHLKIIEKELILEELHPDTQKYYDRFWQCDHCRRIYWEGSHHKKMIEFIKQTFGKE